MSSAAVSARTVVLKMGTAGSPSALATIAEVKSFSGPGPTSEQIDVTNLDSVGSYREFIAGFKDAGEISGVANFVTSHTTASTGVIAAFNDGVVRDFSILFPLTGGNKTATFSGFIKTWSTEISVDGAIPLNFTIKLTGAVTIT